jgi:NAD-dependent deacetylase
LPSDTPDENPPARPSESRAAGSGETAVLPRNGFIPARLDGTGSARVAARRRVRRRQRPPGPREARPALGYILIEVTFASADLDGARRWIDESVRIVALTGAGISTDSGIPDFRGPQGVWTRNPKAEKLSNIHFYMSDPEVRVLSWQSRLEHPAWSAEPNPGHRALVELERRGKLLALITQNIDGLHLRAGHAPDKVIEVHGTMRDVVCMSCSWRGPMPPVLDRVRAGEADPPCERCGGILKSATISFGQALVPHVIARAMRAAEQADLLLAVGTSLQVYPVAGAVHVAKAAGARVAIVNNEPTPFDDLADAVFRRPIGEVLPALCGEGRARV